MSGTTPISIKKILAMAVTVAIVLGMCSCSASYHIRKAQQKDPSLFSDTIRVETIDTLLIEIPKVDTAFIQVRDTLIEYVQKDSLGREVKIKYLWNTKTDSVFIEADCPDQEVVTKVITEQLPPIVLEPTFWQKVEWLVYLMGIVAIVLLVIKLKG